ncbi:uncharacterized protein LOC131856292 [Cryptomeria japonica]|uniref:uncharacterized protein LOC131856292 n=1 Tax=Cryptomeria japonica TaxID=3369 RepID=UPI0027DAA895|nr:uncharacterized protein LOC131856292 [Cryptomeria japonica]
MDCHGRVFGDIPPGVPPNRGFEHGIEMEDGAKPVITTLYRHPRAYKDEIEKTIHELLDMGFIHPSSSPFASSVVLVKKKDGTLRMYLTKKGAFRWTEQAQGVFDRLKEVMSTCPVLALPDFSQPFVLECDASDHNSLKYFLDQTELNDRQQKWVSKIQAYDFDIEFIKGKNNTEVDALSRKPSLAALCSLSEISADWKAQLLVEYYKNQHACELKEQILHDFHVTPTAGHPGYGKTYRAVRERFSWKGLKDDVLRHVRECLPRVQWKDCIYVVVDRLTKYAHFFPIAIDFSASQVAELFFREVFRLHGLPKTIVSDRDSRFMSSFWQELFRLAGTELTPSTSYHPQTDGQTEIVNKWIEGYLRSYVSGQQKDWLQENQDIMRSLRENLQHAQNQQKMYADRHRTERAFEALGQHITVSPDLPPMDEEGKLTLVPKEILEVREWRLRSRVILEYLWHISEKNICKHFSSGKRLQQSDLSEKYSERITPPFDATWIKTVKFYLLIKQEVHTDIKGAEQPMVRGRKGNGIEVGITIRASTNLTRLLRTDIKE